MRVLHVIPSLSVKEGGPSFAIKAMAEALAGQGVQVTVATTTGSREQGVRSERSRAWSMEQGARSEEREAGFGLICFRREFEPYKVSFGLARWLRENCSEEKRPLHRASAWGLKSLGNGESPAHPKARFFSLRGIANLT
jgi:hypothetical protein